MTLHTTCKNYTLIFYKRYKQEDWNRILQGFQTLRQLSSLLQLHVAGRRGGQGDGGISKRLASLLLFAQPYLVSEALKVLLSLVELKRVHLRSKNRSRCLRRRGGRGA